MDSNNVPLSVCGLEPHQFNTLTFNGLGYIYKTTIACYGFATDNYL